MSTVRAQDIMDRAQRVILDETGVRWPLPELCMWINDAQREVVLQKPNALSANIAMQLAAGTYQAIPDGYLGLLRITRNLASMPASQTAQRAGARAIRVVSREVLDSQTPDWHDPTVIKPAQAAKHYLFDEIDQKHFYVFPPNDGTGVVEAILAKEPSIITASTGTDGEELNDYPTVLEVDDIYANAVLDYVLYRAYSKDAQFAGNAQRATLHYQQFANSLGMKIKLEVAVSPNAAAGTKAS